MKARQFQKLLEIDTKEDMLTVYSALLDHSWGLTTFWNTNSAIVQGLNKYSSDQLYFNVFGLIFILTHIDYFKEYRKEAVIRVLEGQNRSIKSNPNTNEEDLFTLDYVENKTDLENLKKYFVDLIVNLLLYTAKDTNALKSFCQSHQNSYSRFMARLPRLKDDAIVDLAKVTGDHDRTELDTHIVWLVKACLRLSIVDVIKERSVVNVQDIVSKQTRIDVSDGILEQMFLDVDSQFRSEIPSYLSYQIECLIPFLPSTADKLTKLYLVFNNLIAVNEIYPNEYLTGSIAILKDEFNKQCNLLIQSEDITGIIHILKFFNKNLSSSEQIVQDVVLESLQMLLSELIDLLTSKMLVIKNVLDLKRISDFAKDLSSDRFPKIYAKLLQILSSEIIEKMDYLHKSLNEYRSNIKQTQETPRTQVPIRATAQVRTTQETSKLRIRLNPISVVTNLNSLVPTLKLENEAQLRSFLIELLGKDDMPKSYNLESLVQLLNLLNNYEYTSTTDAIQKYNVHNANRVSFVAEKSNKVSGPYIYEYFLFNGYNRTYLELTIHKQADGTQAFSFAVTKKENEQQKENAEEKPMPPELIQLKLNLKSIGFDIKIDSIQDLIEHSEELSNLIFEIMIENDGIQMQKISEILTRLTNYSGVLERIKEFLGNKIIAEFKQGGSSLIAVDDPKRYLELGTYYKVIVTRIVNYLIQASPRIWSGKLNKSEYDSFTPSAKQIFSSIPDLDYSTGYKDWIENNKYRVQIISDRSGSVYYCLTWHDH